MTERERLRRALRHSAPQAPVRAEGESTESHERAAGYKPRSNRTTMLAHTTTGTSTTESTTESTTSATSAICTRDTATWASALVFDSDWTTILLGLQSND
jgi:hypothetical protein